MYLIGTPHTPYTYWQVTHTTCWLAAHHVAYARGMYVAWQRHRDVFHDLHRREGVQAVEAAGGMVAV